MSCRYRWAASRASYGFVIIPFVTVLLSAGLTMSRSALLWCWEAYSSWPAFTLERSVPHELTQGR